MAEEVKIHGLAEVRRALRAMPKAMAKRELNKAITPAANLVRDVAIALAPASDKALTRQLRGKTWNKALYNLKDSIAVRSEKKKYLLDAARKRIGVLSSSRDPNVGAWYWRFVELGTSKMQAQPFLTPAFELTKYAASKLIKAALLKGVARQAARVKVKR